MFPIVSPTAARARRSSGIGKFEIRATVPPALYAREVREGDNAGGRTTGAATS